MPLTRQDDFDAVRGFARDVASVLAGRHADELTTEVRKDKRRGRLFLDVARNVYGQTAIAPYAVRAVDGAPVATPIAWEELEDFSIHARSYTTRNVLKRLGQREDPWRSLRRRARKLDRARQAVQRLVDRAPAGS